jgi:hypothetical protein
MNPVLAERGSAQVVSHGHAHSFHPANIAAVVSMTGFPGVG